MIKRYFSLPILLCAATCLAQDDWSKNNHWNFSGEFLLMRRTQIDSDSIVKDGTHTLITTSSLVSAFKYEPGYRVKANFMPDRRQCYELSYFQVVDEEATKHAKGSALSFPFASSTYTHDFTGASSAKVKYKTSIYNGELNYIHYMTPPREDYFSSNWLVGLRFISMPEHFRVAFASDYTIHTRNYLGGAQVGCSIQYNATKSITWDVGAKVGGLVNCAKQHTFLGDYGNSVTLRNHKESKINVALLVDAFAMVGYQWGAHVNTYVGYEVIYLNGVALAPEQIDKETTANAGDELDNEGEATIHGLNVGIRIGF